MEIIHLILGKANPERMNGVNNVVFQLAYQQKLAGKNVSVWGITESPTKNFMNRIFETKLFYGYKNKFKIDPNLIIEIKKLNKETVFHLHGGFIPAFYRISKILKNNNIKFVFTPHGSYNLVAMQKNFLKKKIYSFLFEKAMLKRASAIHCLGKSELEGLKKMSKKTRNVLIPYGYENMVVGDFKPEFDKFVIGFCGRLDIHTKGLDLLLKAFKIVKNVLPNSELWIIGDGADKQKLEKMIKDEELEDVSLLGSKFGENKISLLKKMQIFVHPSRNEGLPTSIIEAASYGIPCVVTSATNVGDIVKKYNCGIVFEKPEFKLLAISIVNLYNKFINQGWEKFSEASKKMVKEEFNWQKNIIHFDKLYEIESAS